MHLLSRQNKITPLLIAAGIAFVLLPRLVFAGSCNCLQYPSAGAPGKQSCIKNIEDKDACDKYLNSNAPDETICDEVKYFSDDNCGAATGSGAVKYEPYERAIEPRLSIPDFNIKFSDIVVESTAEGEQTITVPWLAEYIAAVYQYLIGVATILAIVMMMYGGFRWIVAGGDAGKIGEARKTIAQAAIGLVLALGSYTVLNLISPDLTSFKALRVAVIQREEFSVNVENGGIEQEGQTVTTEGSGERHDWSYTGFDPIFKKYAGCAGLDYRVLKGIAKKESGLNPSIVNRYGFIGLFQTKSCHKSEPNCDLTDPESNTKAVINRLSRATRVIRDRCGNDLPARDFYALLYLSHNSGLGSLTGAKKGDQTATGALDRGGCAGGEKLKNAMAAFWDEWNEIRGSDVKGEKRYNYSLKVADYILSHGVTNPFNTSHGETCTLD